MRTGELKNRINDMPIEAVELKNRYTDCQNALISYAGIHSHSEKDY